METTYRQKKVKIKANSLQNATEITCRQNRVKIKSNSHQNTTVVTCMQKKVMIKSNSLQDTMMVTCMQRMIREDLHGKELKHGLCATLLALSSSVGHVGFTGEVFAKHIHVGHLRCGHMSHSCSLLAPQSGALRISAYRDFQPIPIPIPNPLIAFEH